MNKKEFRKDVILTDNPHNMINLDNTIQRLEAHHDRKAQIKARLDRERTEQEQRVKTDSQKKPDTTQEQAKVRTDSEKRLDVAQDDYLVRRGLKKHPKLDLALDNYLSSRGLDPSNAIANYDPIF